MYERWRPWKGRHLRKAISVQLTNKHMSDGLNLSYVVSCPVPSETIWSR
jgi:hypothetical protein